MADKPLTDEDRKKLIEQLRNHMFSEAAWTGPNGLFERSANEIESLADRAIEAENDRDRIAEGKVLAEHQRDEVRGPPADHQVDALAYALVGAPYTIKDYAGSEQAAIIGDDVDILTIGNERKELDAFVARLNARRALTQHEADRGAVVKALEWRKTESWAEARCSTYGIVSVFQQGNKFDWSLNSIMRCHAKCDTIEDAIAELEEERERRIRSAFAADVGNPAPVAGCEVLSEELVEQAWATLLNRTLPETRPGMALIKFEDLRDIIAWFVSRIHSALASEGAAAMPVAGSPVSQSVAVKDAFGRARAALTGAAQSLRSCEARETRKGRRGWLEGDAAECDRALAKINQALSALTADAGSPVSEGERLKIGDKATVFHAGTNCYYVARICDAAGNIGEKSDNA